jgi:hypothetical protein
MMREILRASLWCLTLAVTLSVGFTQGLAPVMMSHDTPWLQIRYPGEGQTPERTVILSTRKPAIREVLPGRWRITFPPKP